MSYPSQLRLKELFLYDDKKGELIWKKDASSRVKAGDVAGTYLAPSGYYQIKVDGKTYWKHRIIYIWHHGESPEIVDHINQIKTDNRIENLKASCARSNQLNVGARSTKQSGLPKGVYNSSGGKKYYASIVIDGKSMRLGTFDSVDKAADAYRKAESKRIIEIENNRIDNNTLFDDDDKHALELVDDALSRVEEIRSRMSISTGLAITKAREIESHIRLLLSTFNDQTNCPNLERILGSAIAIQEILSDL